MNGREICNGRFDWPERSLPDLRIFLQSVSGLLGRVVWPNKGPDVASQPMVGFAAFDRTFGSRRRQAKEKARRGNSGPRG
jgi:hypothetical protein